MTSSAVYASALAACVAALLLRRAHRRADPAARRLLAAFHRRWARRFASFAPGAAIYFLLPPLVAALGMALNSRWAWTERAGAIAAALLLYLTFGPALGLFEELMNGGPLWAFAPLGAAIMLPALIEFAPLLGRGRTMLVVAGAIDLAIAGWIAAGLTPPTAPTGSSSSPSNMSATRRRDGAVRGQQ